MIVTRAVIQAELKTEIQEMQLNIKSIQDLVGFNTDFDSINDCATERGSTSRRNFLDDQNSSIMNSCIIQPNLCEEFDVSGLMVKK